MDNKLLLKIEDFVLKNKFFLLILGGVFLLRIPSLFEPLWYGDEAIYLTIGQEINRGGLLYVDIFDHKTPGIYYLAAWSLKVLGQTIWSFKFVLMIFLLLSLFFFYTLVKKWFDKKTALVATATLGFLTSITALEGNIVNSELLMILPTIIGFLLGFNKKYFAAGLFLSLSFLLKFTGIFDFGVFFVYLLFTAKSGQVGQQVKNLILLSLGWVIPIALSLAYFASKGALSTYISAALFYNVSYTSYGNGFLVRNGLLIAKALPVFALLAFYFTRWLTSFRKKGAAYFSTFDFLVVWLFFSFYAAVFGGRAYEHYLVQAAASFSIIFALLFTNPKVRKVGIALLAIVAVLTFYLGFRPYVNIGYYGQFFKYISGRYNFEEYAASFNPQIARNYAISSFLNGCSKYNKDNKCVETRTNKGDSLYVYANEPAVYFLADLEPASKYITYFHIAGNENFRKDAFASIKNTKPKYILMQLPELGNFTGLEGLLSTRYNLFALYENFAVYKLDSSRENQ